MPRPKLLVFASGTADGGGSGFENLVRASGDGRLDAEIVGAVSNHAQGGVRKRADALGVPFVHFHAPWDGDAYRRIAQASGADFFALSGWLKLAIGLDPARTFNIHPGPLPEFGGRGMYGRRIHEAVIAAFARGEATHSAACMHFTTADYDRGPVFFRVDVPIEAGDTPDTLAARVNAAEHRWQPEITNLVVQRAISWDGVDPASLRCPDGYEIVRPGP